MKKAVFTIATAWSHDGHFTYGDAAKVVWRKKYKWYV